MLQHDGEPDDGTLVGRIASGDEVAFELAYDRHGGLLFGSLVRFLGDREAAAEVVQDAFMALWRRSSTFDPTMGSLPGWGRRWRPVSPPPSSSCGRRRRSRSRG